MNCDHIEEWCDLRQAVQWIAYGMLPRSPEYEAAFEISTCIDCDNNTKEKEAQSWLRYLSMSGKIKLYGRKGNGPIHFTVSPLKDDEIIPNFSVGHFDRHDEECQIPREEVVAAGSKRNFGNGIDARGNRVWCITHYTKREGWPPPCWPKYIDELCPAAGWAYECVRLQTEDLFREFPSCGTVPPEMAAPADNDNAEVVSSATELPAEAASEAKKEGNKIGRPSSRKAIEQAWNSLVQEGKIDPSKGVVAYYVVIRDKVIKAEQRKPKNIAGLGDEAIRKVISPLLAAHKTTAH